MQSVQQAVLAAGAATSLHEVAQPVEYAGSTAFGFLAVAIATLSCVLGASLVFYSPGTHDKQVQAAGEEEPLLGTTTTTTTATAENTLGEGSEQRIATSQRQHHRRGRMILVDARTRLVFGAFMAFSAGTMLFTSLADLLPEAKANLKKAFGHGDEDGESYDVVDWAWKVLSSGNTNITYGESGVDSQVGKPGMSSINGVSLAPTFILVGSFLFGILINSILEHLIHSVGGVHHHGHGEVHGGQKRHGKHGEQISSSDVTNSTGATGARINSNSNDNQRMTNNESSRLSARLEGSHNTGNGQDELLDAGRSLCPKCNNLDGNSLSTVDGSATANGKSTLVCSVHGPYESTSIVGSKSMNHILVSANGKKPALERKSSSNNEISNIANSNNGSSASATIQQEIYTQPAHLTLQLPSRYAIENQMNLPELSPLVRSMHSACACHIDMSSEALIQEDMENDEDEEYDDYDESENGTPIVSQSRKGKTNANLNNSIRVSSQQQRRGLHLHKCSHNHSGSNGKVVGEHEKKGFHVPHDHLHQHNHHEGDESHRIDIDSQQTGSSLDMEITDSIEKHHDHPLDETECLRKEMPIFCFNKLVLESGKEQQQIMVKGGDLQQGSADPLLENSTTAVNPINSNSGYSHHHHHFHREDGSLIFEDIASVAQSSKKFKEEDTLEKDERQKNIIVVRRENQMNEYMVKKTEELKESKKKSAGTATATGSQPIVQQLNLLPGSTVPSGTSIEEKCNLLGCTTPLCVPCDDINCTIVTAAKRAQRRHSKGAIKESRSKNTIHESENELEQEQQLHGKEENESLMSRSSSDSESSDDVYSDEYSVYDISDESSESGDDEEDVMDTESVKEGGLNEYSKYVGGNGSGSGSGRDLESGLIRSRRRKLAHKKNKKGKDKRDSTLFKTGFSTAVAIAIHKFPEGFVIFTSSGFYPNHTVAITILIALCLHNVAEGLAISLPIYLATGDRLQSFLFACCMSTISPFLGAGLELVIAQTWSKHHHHHDHHEHAGEPEKTVVSPLVFGIVFAIISGMLVWIVVDGMLPSAQRILTMKTPRDERSGTVVRTQAERQRESVESEERARRTITVGVVLGIAAMLLCSSILES